MYEDGPICLTHLRELLASVDEMIIGAAATQVELLPFPLVQPPAMVRQWRNLVVSFGSKATHDLLAPFGVAIQTSVERYGNPIPSWAAGFRTVR